MGSGGTLFFCVFSLSWGPSCFLTLVYLKATETERKSTLGFHSNGQVPPDDQHALLFIPSGAPTRQNSLRLQPRDAGGVSLLSGRHPRLQCAWISSGTAPEREARTNGVYPSSSTPSMIDHVIPHRAPTVIYVGTTRRQRMRCLSGLAWPPLL